MPPYDPERDLRIIEAMADQIDTYLVEEELLWPISGRVSGGMPRMTLGGFLLREHRLDSLQKRLDSPQRDRFAMARQAFHKGLAQWPVNGTRKIVREAEMRLNLLEQFLRDCDDTVSHNCFDYWPSQAEQRTTLHHVSAALGGGPLADSDQAVVVNAALARVDSGLRRYLLAGNEGAFLWDPALEPVYPRREYWWLWVVPPEDDAS
jgi:hypothetical protein